MVLNVPCSWAISRIALERRDLGEGEWFSAASCAVAALLIGVAGTSGPTFAQKKLAQYQPLPPQAYPAAPPQAYPATPQPVYPQRPLPPMDGDEDAAFYDPPVYGRPLPPGTVRLAPGTTVPPEAIEAPPPAPAIWPLGPGSAGGRAAGSSAAARGLTCIAMVDPAARRRPA